MALLNAFIRTQRLHKGTPRHKARAARYSSTFKTELTTRKPEECIVYPSIIGEKSYEEVPGPKPLPFLGNTWRFIPYIGNFKLDEISKISVDLYNQYGDIVKISGLIGRPDMVFLYKPSEVERILKLEDTLPFRPSMPSLDYYKHVLRTDFFQDVGGVIATHGTMWENFRAKVQHIMLQPKTSKFYITPIESIADEFVNRIGQIKDESNTVPENFLNEIQKWALESLAKIALDVKLNSFSVTSKETQKFIDAIGTFFKAILILELKSPLWRFYNTPTWLSFVDALDTITSYSLTHIEAALDRLKNTSKERKNSEDISLLERVLLQNQDNPKIAVILALDMFLVGIDTTSATVSSILYQLSQHKEKQNILYEEVSRIVGAGPLSSQSFNEMPYLKACIKETLRMYPVVFGNGRCLSMDTNICGYNIPKGVQIVFQHFIMGNSDKYFDDSHEFRPERWLKSCGKAYHPYASLPFGHGRRMCLGKRFADLEIQTVIAKIISAYDVQFHGEKLPYVVHPIYMPHGPLKFTFVDR
ncbi:probable cytochrome P450 49a1 [Rhodnius prolixus]|uniref:probable cytochrome P450 49a1 n=1 Tax=Rhodnius prolixus TaxID=13249 RepID=UPI003D18A18A